MAVMTENRAKCYPKGFIGFLAKLRDTGALAKMPGGWVKAMIALYSHRNDKGFAWPSQRTLASEAGVDRRTVRRYLKWAKACLGIHIERKKCNYYYLPLNEEVDPWFPANRAKRIRPKRTPQHPKELEAKN